MYLLKDKLITSKRQPCHGKYLMLRSGRAANGRACHLQAAGFSQLQLSVWVCQCGLWRKEKLNTSLARRSLGLGVKLPSPTFQKKGPRTRSDGRNEAFRAKGPDESHCWPRQDGFDLILRSKAQCIRRLPAPVAILGTKAERMAKNPILIPEPGLHS